jgi:hypothetical protein
MLDNPVFDLYRDQKACVVSLQGCIDTGAKSTAAWELDKYKFINMLVRAWEMRPGMVWYVFAEADTYIFWPNLVAWLNNHADPDEMLYAGSVTLIDDFPFAHGGSGYVISGTLLRAVVEEAPDLADRYNVKASETCCGDLLVGKALQEAGVTVRHGYPMFFGEKPWTLPFGNGFWCEPTFTMHHVDSEEVSLLWQLEQTRMTEVSTLTHNHGGALRSTRDPSCSKTSTRGWWRPIWWNTDQSGIICPMICVILTKLPR